MLPALNVVNRTVGPNRPSTTHGGPEHEYTTTAYRADYCDNVFEAGGVGNSIVRLARGLCTAGNVQADIIMFDVSEQAEFNPHGRNGITQRDQQVDSVTIFRLSPWTGGTKTAQHWVDMHYALLELSEERQYDI